MLPEVLKRIKCLNRPLQFTSTFITTLCIMHYQLSNVKAGLHEVEALSRSLPAGRSRVGLEMQVFKLIPLSQGPVQASPTQECVSGRGRSVQLPIQAGEDVTCPPD